MQNLFLTGAGDHFISVSVIFKNGDTLEKELQGES